MDGHRNARGNPVLTDVVMQVFHKFSLELIKGIGNAGPIWQFWLDWFVKLLGAIATLSVAFIGLFGSWLRFKIWPPKLTIRLADEKGTPTTLVFFDKTTNQQSQTPAFWYHVQVDNETRWNPVTELYIFLLLIEEKDASGAFKAVWQGRAALGWRHEANPQPKKIGYTSECDLCHILENPRQVCFSPIFRGQVRDCYTEKFKIAVTLQARGLEAESNSLRIEISWDGNWSADKEELSRHLVVKKA
jgi:hypothetical protein